MCILDANIYYGLQIKKINVVCTVSVNLVCESKKKSTRRYFRAQFMVLTASQIFLILKSQNNGIKIIVPFRAPVIQQETQPEGIGGKHVHYYAKIYGGKAQLITAISNK